MIFETRSVGVVIILVLMIHLSCSNISIATSLHKKCKNCIDRLTATTMDGPKSCANALQSMTSHCANECQSETGDNALRYLYQTVQIKFFADECANQMYNIVCDELQWECFPHRQTTPHPIQHEEFPNQCQCSTPDLPRSGQRQPTTSARRNKLENETYKSCGSEAEGNLISCPGLTDGTVVGFFFFGLIVGALLLLVFMVALSKIDNTFVQIKCNISFHPNKPQSEPGLIEPYGSSDIIRELRFVPDEIIDMNEPVYIATNDYEIPISSRGASTATVIEGDSETMSESEETHTYLELVQDSEYRKDHDYLHIRPSDSEHTTTNSLCEEERTNNNKKLKGKDNCHRKNGKPVTSPRPKTNTSQETLSNGTESQHSSDITQSDEQTTNVDANIENNIYHKARPVIIISNDTDIADHTDESLQAKSIDTHNDNSNFNDDTDDECHRPINVKGICAVFELNNTNDVTSEV